MSTTGFCISETNPNFAKIMDAIQDKMNEVFGQNYEDDLFSYVKDLLTKPTTKENVQQELFEVFEADTHKPQVFLSWLWTFFQEKGIFDANSVSSSDLQNAEPKNSGPNQKPAMKPTLIQKKKPRSPIPQPNNSTIKGKPEIIEVENQNLGEQPNKDKKSILDRIKKPKIPPKITNQPNPVRSLARDLKKNLGKAPFNNVELKEKLFNKKIKTDAFPAKNLVAEENEKNEENIEENQIQQKEIPSTIKKRCRDWPQCKNEKCMFHHPTEQCKKFPKCSFGNLCLYIHPLIECKFGAYCQRQDCAYMHPKMPAFQPPRFMPGKPFMLKGKKRSNPFLNQKNVTLDTTNEIKMKSNEEVQSKEPVEN